MSDRVEIRDWVDATRPMRSAVQDALHRLREAIEPSPRDRITQPSMMSPHLVSDVSDASDACDEAELHTQIERALDALQE